MCFSGFLQHISKEARLPPNMDRSNRTNPIGHLCAFIATCVWATTYISTKKLLLAFTPAGILVVRTTLALALLSLIAPKRMKYDKPIDRLFVALAGFFGIFLYYFLENTALKYTSAANVGVIVATAPFFTLSAARILLKEDVLKGRYFVGFALSMAGIIALTIPQDESVALSPKGDLLALLAIVVWAIYTVLTKVIGSKGYPNLGVTRNMFFYGLLGHLTVLAFEGGFQDPTLIVQSPYVLHFLFLGLIASALCFLLWNHALRTIGPVGTSFYLYVSPIITIVFSRLILVEPFGLLDIIGTALTLTGVVLGQWEKR